MNLNWLKFTPILLLYFFAISTQVFAQTDELSQECWLRGVTGAIKSVYMLHRKT